MNLLEKQTEFASSNETLNNPRELTLIRRLDEKFKQVAGQFTKLYF